ncbi:MAG: O-antigen ligase, partial [Bacteroidia bacterium]
YHGSSNHSSLLMRWVYFKVGLDIMLNNPVLGVGTGDMRLAYRSAYDKDDRGMLPKFQDISHNQFLSVGIVVGLSGLLWFIFALLFPVGLYYKDYLYLMFIALVLTSFLTDNTLGTQSGVTLFAFFNSLLIIRKEFSDTDG